MFCSSSATKGHTRILKLSAGCGYIRGVFKAWKDMDHRGCLARCGLEMPDFVIRTAARKFHPEHVVILQLTPALLLSSRTPGCSGFYAHRIFYTARPRKRVSSSIGIGLEYFVALQVQCIHLLALILVFSFSTPSNRIS